MKRAWRVLTFILFAFEFSNFTIAQDYDDDPKPPAPPPAQDTCNGIFVAYYFISRHKIYPLLKNAETQAWAFNSTVTVINTGSYELKAWKVYVGFQHKEILVAASGGVLVNGEDFPAEVGKNGTYFSGAQMTDLKTSISTGGDYTQIQATIQISGTQFGLKSSVTPMPKTIRLVNDGFKCPSPTKKKTSMTVCCVRNPKSKVTSKAIKFLPRQTGDLSISYDITQSYGNNYQAQVTLENISPLGRLDHWNISWEWMRGEFIQTMQGAYTHKMDYLPCIYGTPGQYYQQMDFSKVMNCEKKPTIGDLPRERSNDSQVGRIPYCCRNGSLLSPVMNKTEAKSVFQLQVFKLPPDLDRKTLYPPEKWKISGVISANYKCGQPLRVDPSEFPDPSGLQASKKAIASWQVICNITRPEKRKNRCCVTFSSYKNDSVIPCNTCACGCDDTRKCNPKARAMFLPPEAILVPFENRSSMAKAWAKIKHFHVPKPLPCGDNCGVSINWHLLSDYTDGWTARVTLFNWLPINFEDWFTAFELKKGFGRGYENAYSFNGTKLTKPKDVIFLQGLKGLNFLVMQTNGSKPGQPKVPGKQQSVISFKKRHTRGIQVDKGDGFPAKVYFNGEECELPTAIPSYGNRNYHVNFIVVIFLSILSFAM